MREHAVRIVSCVVLMGVWLIASSALAAVGPGFGGGGWGSTGLANITSELTGPVAGSVAVIALAAGGVGLMFGRDFGGLAHTASYVSIVGGLVGAAGSVLGSDAGGLLP